MAIKRTIIDIFGTLQGNYYALGAVTQDGSNATVRWDFYVSKAAKDAGSAPVGDALLTWKGNSPFTPEALQTKSVSDIAHEASIATGQFPGAQIVP
jgi:hypothetical protein